MSERSLLCPPSWQSGRAGNGEASSVDNGCPGKRGGGDCAGRDSDAVGSRSGGGVGKVEKRPPGSVQLSGLVRRRGSMTALESPGSWSELVRCTYVMLGSERRDRNGRAEVRCVGWRGRMRKRLCHLGQMFAGRERRSKRRQKEVKAGRGSKAWSQHEESAGSMVWPKPSRTCVEVWCARGP
jgi:hypothetical protein